MNTFRCLLILSAITLLFGCNVSLIPLKGTYPNTTLEVVSKKSVDSIWAGINTIFVSNGLTIKEIDKQKGLIISNKSDFIPVYSFEDSNGHLEEANSWAVFERTFMNNKEWHPTKISSKWNIQVTDMGNGESKIKMDTTVVCTYDANWYTKMEDMVRTTGKLEELIKKMSTQ